MDADDGPEGDSEVGNSFSDEELKVLCGLRGE